jgi:hypothetical protein
VLGGALIILLKPNFVFAQSEEAQQLLLDVEKLAQFKQILSDLKKGYDIISSGYEAIKNISEGNFNLHQNFLNNLLQVSPAVQSYQRIADIISYQLRIVKEYKAAFNQFKTDKNFTVDEIDYVGKVYSHLLNASLKSLDDLITVITAGKLRMSDEERIKAIDHVWSDIGEQYSFLKDFNTSTAMLSEARQKEQEDVDLSKKLLDINK